MKIVHVIDYFAPQLGYHEKFLPTEHLKMGHDVCVITSDRHDPLLWPSAAKLLLGDRIKDTGFFMEEGIPTWRLKTKFERWPNIIWIAGLERKIKELSPDVVIVHGIAKISAVRVALLKKRQKKFKVVYDEHMTFDASRSRAKILYPLFRLLCSNLILTTADGLVGTSNVSKLWMNKKYGFPLDSIRVIPLGADNILFRYDAFSRETTRKQLSLEPDDLVFIYAGKLVAEKGPHVLVEAGIILLRREYNMGIKILLVGNGPATYVEMMEQLINAHSLTSSFIWHDLVPNEELYKFYSAADVAIWPRQASLSMMEAMSTGLPIIISDDSEVTERLEYGNGLTYKNEDAADLAHQMETLFDSDLRKKMGTQGRKLVDEKLSWSTLAKQFIDLVE